MRVKLITDQKRDPVFMIPTDRKVDVQVREKTDLELVENYRERLATGCEFRPSDAVYDKDTDEFYLYDGIHTFAARMLLDEKSIPAAVILGKRLDALMRGGQRNDTHGKPPTPADKRHQTEMYLRTPELRAMSNNTLARLGGVAPQTVESVREELENDPDNPAKRPGVITVMRKGQQYTMAAANATKENAALKSKRGKHDIGKQVKTVRDGLKKRMEKLSAANKASFIKGLRTAIETLEPCETKTS